MHFRNFIRAWAILALLFGQLALAQHSASHIDHGFSQEITATAHDLHDGHHHDQGSKKHECPECVLTQALQSAFYNSPSLLRITPESQALEPVQYSVVISTNRYNSNAPRAPPALLI